ncbi:hypothetical protein [Lacticaseibacillus nasuensis]|uniref:Uncharacterized protein n=1 Tax=Lacticaseibacillus nasuensis JCM 17158 TaxID=1291734 RepID=A0A0R1JZZ7_9LACO|nr:hypothetical protein [Lacticaseibacillus nasuensis]KRK72631.1 hypothetical protein FD02_GL001604 [Lacticaseibacillus nasuensis JCM 17158]
MHKITDERLIKRNLMNIRVAFAVENLAILVILGVQFVKGMPWGQVVSYTNLPFLILMIGCFTTVVMSVNISAPTADKRKVPVNRVLLQGLVAWVIFALLFRVMIGGRPWLSLLCGLVVAGVVTGIMLFANHYRDSDDAD